MFLLRANLTGYQLYRLLVVLNLVRIGNSLPADPLGVHFGRARCLLEHGVSGHGQESNVLLLRLLGLHDWPLCNYHLEQLRADHKKRSRDHVDLREDGE